MMPSRAAGVDWRLRPVLPPAATALLDKATIAQGTPGSVLMEAAGRAVTRTVMERFPPQPVLVLCGPGNNGGDGYVVARRLRRAGWPVRVAALGDTEALRGDAAWARQLWSGPVEPLTAEPRGGEGIVVDALFGVGLTRPLEGMAAAAIAEVNQGTAQIVAIDVPSGIDAATGAVLGVSVQAKVTVSFCTAKPGHLLLPGRISTGELLVADIGIPPELIAKEEAGIYVNDPALWRETLPARGATSHKYKFGHAGIIGGAADATGAARLAANAALRVGAGLVSVLAAPEAIHVYAAHLTTIMTRPFTSVRELGQIVPDRRINAVLIGPGAGVGERTLGIVRALLGTGGALVLDADALTSIAASMRSGELRLSAGCVLTPHDGEFARLFDAKGDRLTRASAAARTSGATVLLKGGDTVVAAPDGRASILVDAPPSLATAGTGDVLAGLIVGLVAQGVPPFEAASAGAWLHAAAAREAGEHLIAEDLPDQVPKAIALAS